MGNAACATPPSGRRVALDVAAPAAAPAHVHSSSERNAVAFEGGFAAPWSQTVTVAPFWGGEVVLARRDADGDGEGADACVLRDRPVELNAVSLFRHTVLLPTVVFENLVAVVDAGRARRYSGVLEAFSVVAFSGLAVLGALAF